MGNKLDKAKGRTKEVVGTMSQNHELEAKGKAEQKMADLKQKAHDVKEHMFDHL